MKLSKRNRWPVVLFLLPLFLLPALRVGRADGQELPWNGAHFAADPAAVLAASSTIARDPSAAATIFLEERHLILDSEERVRMTLWRVYRVESQAGVEAWSETGSEWWPWRQKRPEVRARVIAPDGAIHNLDPSVLTDAAAGAERPEVYDDARNFSGPLPAVTVGSIVEEEVVVEDTAALFPGAFSRRIYFGHDEPVLRSVLTIDAPTSMALRYSTRLLPDVEIKKAESNGTSSLRFEQGLLKAIHNKDKALPDDVPLWPAVDFSAASSWNAVAAAYYHAVESSLRPADVSVLLEGSKGLSGEALLRRLLTSLHQQVRYTGVEFGISSLIPHSPKETVGRKYGDCKDKAVVLVSLLKAVGIPAQLALLSTRGSDDVNPDLPGLGLFDHAIVYLPGAPGRFIDATAEYLDPGSLPWMDQGRLALVVDPGTTSLLRIPVAAPGNNLLVEKRDFTLAEYGPARIVETSEPRGAMESNYRAAYGETDAKETHEALEKYMKDEYSAEALTSATHAPSTDLTKDFSLRLEAARGKRGYSSLNDAVVVIYPSGIVNQLPAAVQPQGDEEAPSADQAESNKRTHDVFFEQVAIEWRYHIVPPPTFAAQPLPEDRNIPLGPASVTEHFKKEADGSVSAIVRFDSAKPRYTVEELQAFRLADTKLRNSDGILIRFVQEGAALQAEGRVKEALASYASLVALHPAEALHHSQIAYAMLDAGLGQQARDEAKKAVTLDATSPVAFQTQAWILQHDLIGRRFGTGFDLEGAIAAYRKAAELDPKDYATKANLAILLEYDANGNRYSSKAHLGQAVEEYKAVATLDPRRSKEYDDNLLYVLAYSQRWKEAAEKAASLPGNATRQSILVAAAAAEQGPEAGIAEAGRRTSSDADRSGALMNAANLLFKLRMYPQGVALLSASAGQQGSADVRARIQALSNVRPYEQLLLPATNVNRVVQDYFMCLMEAGFTPDKILRIIEFDPGDKKDVVELFSRENVTTRSHFRTQGIPDAVILDTVFSNLKFSVEGDDASGYRVRAQPIGAPPVVFLISHQPGGNRIVSVGDEYFMVGAEVLRRLAAGDTKNAKLWLDWAREGITLQTGDDPLGGSLFARFWTRGDDPDPAKMKLAALAALVDSSQIGEHLGELQAARAAAAEADQANMDLLIANAANKAKNWKLEKEAASRLLARYPRSDNALRLFSTACQHTEDWTAWEAAISARLTKLPDDEVALRSSARLAVWRGDFVASRAVFRKMIDSGRQNASDLNGYSWEALFTGTAVTDEDIAFAQQANKVTGGKNFGILHTLACLYAETGKGKEARELLLAAMQSAGLDQPNAGIWYGFGRIAEDYGVFAAARADYDRMEAEPGDESPDSTRRLALSRLRKMKNSGF